MYHTQREEETFINDTVALKSGIPLVFYEHETWDK